MTARAALLAGAVALLPVTIAAATAVSSPEVLVARFLPPESPLLLTRTLYRSLSDGKMLIVTRTYAIRFTSDGDGYRLDGEQIGAEVQAPAGLAGLAEIERKRVDTGLFPAMLDQFGMIRSGGAATLDPALRQQVVTQANGIIAKADLTVPVKREGIDLVGQLAAVPNGTAWPSFLFNPGSRERVETRLVPMADGSEGVVEVRVRADGIAPGGLPQRVERTVTTRLAGTEKVSREVWTIAPAMP